MAQIQIRPLPRHAYRLDRCGCNQPVTRSVADLVEIEHRLNAKGVALRILSWDLDTTPRPAG